MRLGSPNRFCSTQTLLILYKRSRDGPRIYTLTEATSVYTEDVGSSTLSPPTSLSLHTVKPVARAAAPRPQLRLRRDAGRALRWADRRLFAELMLAWDLRSYDEAARQAGAVVFDRGVPDVIGYLELSGLAPPPHFHAAARACRYSHTVFVTPPWPEIFVQDAERKQSPEEAEATFRAVTGVYRRLGYELQEVPRGFVAARADFILARIG